MLMQATSTFQAKVTGDREMSVSGVLDLHTADDFSATIRELGCYRNLTLDLSGITFIDSSGLRRLIGRHKEFEAAGNQLVIKASSASLDRLVEITGLRDYLHFI